MSRGYHEDDFDETTVGPWEWDLRRLTASVNVLGRENLTKKRPAIFIFNHRNNFDGVITASLLKDNWTGVGKKELENDPVVGTLGKQVDTIFIDRDDPKAAVESLHHAEDLIENGLSVMIAPEGVQAGWM